MKLAEFGDIAEASRLVGMLPFLKTTLDKMERAVENRVKIALERGEFTPDQAMMAWQEKMLIRKLFDGINMRVNVGTSVAQSHKEELNGTS